MLGHFHGKSLRYVTACLFVRIMFETFKNCEFHVHMKLYISMATRTLPEKSQNKGFLTKLVGIPSKLTKLPSQCSMLGNHTTKPVFNVGQSYYQASIQCWAIILPSQHSMLGNHTTKPVFNVGQSYYQASIQCWAIIDTLAGR